jgi:hypothetical protein
MKNLLLIGLIAFGAWYLTKPDKRAFVTQHLKNVSSQLVTYLPLFSDSEIDVLYNLIKQLQVSESGTLWDNLNAQWVQIANKYGIPIS